MTGILVAVMAAITLASVAGTGLAQAQTNALTDRAALVARYNATDGPNWANRADWLSGQPIGDWYGIVTDDSGRTCTLQRARTHTLPRGHGRVGRRLRPLPVHAGQAPGGEPVARGLAEQQVPPENRRKTAGKPLENRGETTGKTVGKPPKTAGKSPVFE